MNLKIQILAGNTLMSRFHVGFEIVLPLGMSDGVMTHDASAIFLLIRFLVNGAWDDVTVKIPLPKMDTDPDDDGDGSDSDALCSSDARLCKWWNSIRPSSYRQFHPSKSEGHSLYNGLLALRISFGREKFPRFDAT